MVVRELEQILFEELGFAGRPEVFHGNEIPWSNGRAIPDINAALFLKNVPIAYFSRLGDLDEDKIRQLHKNVWSQSKSPLLFVTLPHEIRIYNGYQAPPLSSEEDLNAPERLLQRLTDLTDQLTARQSIQQTLVEETHYERVYLETGAFWDTSEGRRIDYQSRADKQLVDGMGQMRTLLINAGLTNHLAYTLLGRSIFIRYLEDRDVLTPEWIEQMTDGRARSYREALEIGRDATYQLFERLSQRFNGDLFPVAEDETDTNEIHLELLLSFLNRTNLETGQLSFWPYNFEYIPIELISHIYDTFIDDQRASGAYYTPLLLADFILEETMGDEVIRSDMTVLDPACGSGIFLVGAYRRLVQAWRRQHGAPTPANLNHILQHGIFGVDKNQEAVGIAAFSLYLEILNHLTKEQIREVSFRFPSLGNRNLFISDFFAEDVDEHFANREFDRVIGNMPWGRGTLTEKADEWLNENDYVVGGRQAAPAFMLRVPQFVDENGEIALLAPAKSTIFVTSETHQIFRETLFANFQMRAIVNFSALVYELFSGSISPAVAFFYSTTPPGTDDRLVYGVPKPSPLSQHLKAIVLDTTEIKFINRDDLLEHPQLWKVSQWGTPRDAALVRRLGDYPVLQQIADELGWHIKEGFMAQYRGSDRIEAQWLQNMPFVPVDRFLPYLVEPFGVVNDSIFHRPRTQDIYQGPLTLIHHSKCEAAFLPAGRVAYKSKVTGVVGQQGQEKLLKWLTVYINSPLALYYHFLTSTSWAVERGTIIHSEYKQMPFPLPNLDDPNFKLLLDYFDQIVELLQQRTAFPQPSLQLQIDQIRDELNALVYELLNIHSVEKQLIEDTLAYGIEFFQWVKRRNRRPRSARPVQEPDTEMLKSYAEIFTRTATSLLRVKSQTLSATVYKNGAPLTVVSFDLVNLDEAHSVQVVDEHRAMRSKLRELDRYLLDRRTPSMYMRRHVRVYDGNTVSLVRPSEQRFWTQSQARADADAFLAELTTF